MEDLTQQVSLRLMCAFERDSAQNVDALVMTVCKRTWMDHLRVQSRARRYYDAFTQEQKVAATATSIQGGWTDSSWGDLTERLALIANEFFVEKADGGCGGLLRSFLKSREWKDVATELGIEAATVRKRWSRCLGSLKQALTTDPRWREIGDAIHGE